MRFQQPHCAVEDRLLDMSLLTYAHEVRCEVGSSGLLARLGIKRQTLPDGLRVGRLSLDEEMMQVNRSFHGYGQSQIARSVTGQQVSDVREPQTSTPSVELPKVDPQIEVKSELTAA